MPPRGYEKKHKLPPRASKVAVEAPSMPITRNNGELGAEGLRIRPSLWSNCTEEKCGRPIYFIRVGERCTRHELRLERIDV